MSMRLFGTDGVRGTPGEPPLDERTLARLGAALVKTCGRAGASIRVLIAAFAMRTQMIGDITLRFCAFHRPVLLEFSIEGLTV